MSVRKQFRLLAAALCAAGSASATLITSQVGPGNFIFAGTVLLPNMTSATFANPAGGRIVVTYSAECAVDAPAGNHTAYSDVDIQVLNAANGALVATLSPTPGNQDAFCSANGTVGFDGWVRPSISVASLPLPGIALRVRVIGRVTPGARAWHGDRSLVISR